MRAHGPRPRTQALDPHCAFLRLITQAVMGSFTDYAEAKILDHITGKTSFTMPSVWVALFTVTPTDAGGGTEVTGGSYARKSTTGTDWQAAAAGATQNAAAITFVTPSGSWGTVVAFALMDAVTAGNMLAWSLLTTPQAVGTGNVVSFAIGDLDITLD